MVENSAVAKTKTRLPTILECKQFMLSGGHKKLTAGDEFVWSSTPYQFGCAYAWTANYKSGTLSNYLKEPDGGDCVRLVRDECAPKDVWDGEQFYMSDCGEWLLDQKTGIEWKMTIEPGRCFFDHAIIQFNDGIESEPV